MNRLAFLTLSTFVPLAAQPAIGQGQQSGTLDAVREAIQSALSVSDYSLQHLVVPATVSGGFATTVELGGQTQLIQARPHSNRGLDFRVLVDEGRDQLVPFEPDAPATFQGELVGIEGSNVTGSVLNGQLHAVAWAWEGATWVIQPLTDADPSADPTVHVVYDVGASIPGDWQCIEVPSSSMEEQSGGILGTGIRWCEIAFDCDVEFLNKNGGSVTNTINDVELIMSLVNVIYERDVNILFDIGTIIVRTSEPDPYSTTNPNTLLTQFDNHWSSTKSFVKRDTAHMMTGKNLDGGVIGIAYLSVICSQASGFGLSESRFTNGLNMRAGLTAHEIGHNYSAQHCSGASCFIMCATINGCGHDVTKFGTTEQTQIENYSATRSCTPELAPPLVFPWSDTFEGASIDNGKWPSLQGAATSTLATGEPSGTSSVNLDTVSSEDFADDYLRSNYVLMAGLSGKKATFYTQHVGVESGETLSLEYLASTGDWTPGMTVTSDGNNQSPFQFQTFELPANAYHDDFRVGLRVNGSTTDDEWYVDDFSLTDGCPAPANYCSTSPNSVGSGAVMTFAGSTSLAANDLMIIAFAGPPGQTGIFFYGPNQSLTPFGNGFLCVSGGITRLPVQSIDVFGDATHSFDASAAGFTIGETENFQFWYRDPMGGGAFFNLSDGLSTTWCP